MSLREWQCQVTDSIETVSSFETQTVELLKIFINTDKHYLHPVA